jgi:threonine aldolase
MRFIDLRSDTVTHPTDEMREAMFKAVVGDDVYGDDPTVNELEEFAAKMLGKEAALFVPSGTFGNQLCLFTHCNRGDEVILGDDCHIVQHEVGAASVIAGVQLRTLKSDRGQLNPLEVDSTIRRGEDIHYPKTGLICVENAHSNGLVIPLENMAQIYGIAVKSNIPVHLDGARLFNAAAYLKADVKDIAKYCNSVMFCLSKGLCSPVGSIVAGDRTFIDKARKGRKLMGGGLRQAGVLAASGLVSLKKMANRLEEDHDNAVLLGAELSKIPGIELDMDNIHINMVFFDMSKTGFDTNRLVSELLNKGVKVNNAENGIMRFVTNYWVTADDIDYVVNSIKEIINS